MGRKFLATALATTACLALSAVPAQANHRGGFVLDVIVGNDGHDVRVESDHRIMDVTVEFCDSQVTTIRHGPAVRGRTARMTFHPSVVLEVWVHLQNVDEDFGERGIPATGPLNFC